MQLQEGLAEAGGEGGGGLGDAPLGAGQLCGEAGQEVVLSLLGGQDGHGGQHAEGIGGQEDHVLGSGSRGHGTDDLLNVGDGVGHTGVLGDGLVGKVASAVLGHGDVLQQGVAADGVVDVGLGLLVQVDDLGIAAALEVEHAVVVPAVLVVADQQTLGIGGQGGLAGAGQAEEDGGVLTVHVGVGGAVHGSDALQRQVVVHHGEHTLLHLAAVPGVDDNLLTGADVEGHAGFGVQAQLLVVLNLGLGSVVDDEVGLEVLQLLLGGTDEHIGDKVSLPCHFHNEADSHAGVGVGAAEGIHNVQLLAAQLPDGQILDGLPDLLGHGVVVVLVLVGSPPNGVLGVLVHDDVLVLRRTAGVDAGHNVDSIQFGLLAHFVTGEAGLGLFLVEHLVGRIADDFRGAGNAVLFNSVSFHDGVPPIIYGVKNERQKPRFQHILVNTLESPKFHQIHINTPLPESKQDFR